MPNILIYSNDHQLIEHCKANLPASYVIDVIKAFNTTSPADILLLDATLIKKTPELLSLAAKHAHHFLILGHQWTDNQQINALLQGCSGYFDRSQPWNLLNKAIMHIQNGDIWIHRRLIPKVIQAMSALSEKNSPTPPHTANKKINLSQLSKRETEVADMLAQGQSNKQIARQLKISERTVKAHLTSIFRKLNISDRLQLALLVKEST